MEPSRTVLSRGGAHGSGTRSPAGWCSPRTVGSPPRTQKAGTLSPTGGSNLTTEELLDYSHKNSEVFWADAGQHWINDRFNLSPDSRAIDVGGYLGDWTAFIASKHRCFVDVYEPVQLFHN